MIYRIFPQKDTFITNFKKSTVAQTGSNFGSSEILHLFKVSPLSTSSGIISGSVSRILMKFDTSEISELTASRSVPAENVSYRLRLKNARHAKTLPSSFDVEVSRLTQDWDEGRGHDVDNFSDKGFANWDKPKSNSFWTTPGADQVAGLISTVHFDNGAEDLSVDVTNIVNSWIDGSAANNGFLIKLSSSLEDNSLDYYIKMFHGRETSYGDRKPYIEASWDDSIKDDRNNFIFDNTGSLYLYNIVRGALVDISGIGTGQDIITVDITDASGTIKTVSGSHTGMTGIYSASFSIAAGEYSGSVFNDIWSVGSNSYMTSSFTPVGNFSKSVLQSNQNFVNVIGLKNEYEQDEVVRFNLFVRDKDYNPAVVLTASSGPMGQVVTKAYYRIDNDRTDEVVVSFGTGSVENTRLSYDSNGNYFDFYIKSLPVGNVYRIVFLFDINGQKRIVDNGFKFKVM